MDGAVLYRVYDLPWSTGAEQEERFHRLLKTSLIVLLLASLIFSVLPAAKRGAADVEEVPQRFARLLTERQAPPPPPPPVVREEPVPEPIPVPEPEPVVVQERVVEPEPVPVPAPQPLPEPEPIDRTQQARERAQGAGLLPFADQLASLRDATTAQRLDQTGMTGAADAAASVSERSLITSRAGTASGGINTAALSRDTGGGGLAGRATTQVESPVETLGAAASSQAGAQGRTARSREEIEQVFDRNKGAIYALYNRALRQNPGLEGRLVLRLTIAPTGEVTACDVVSSELGDPELEQRLVQRVMLFRFEAKDVEAITTTKPIEFFPA